VKIILIGILFLCALSISGGAKAPDSILLKAEKKGADVVLTWTGPSIHGVYKVYRGTLRPPFNRWTKIATTDKNKWTDVGAAKRRTNNVYRVTFSGATP
jgi:fibronectin type 3 domain-containing protein